MQGQAYAKAMAAGAAADTGETRIIVSSHAEPAAAIAPQPAARPRDAHIQGLRGLAMCIVFLGHFSGSYLTLPGHNENWIRLFAQINAAQFGSSTFLMIAGYMLYARTYQDASFRWKSYLQTRLLRLIPLYWLALAGKAAWEIGIAGRNRIPAGNGDAAVYLLKNAFLLFPFLKAPALITVSWTMTYLFLGYLLVPAIAQAEKRWGLEFRSRIAVLGAFAAFWIVVPMFWSRLGWNGLGVALGMLVYELNRKWALRKRSAQLWDLAVPVLLFAGCAFFLGLQKGTVRFPSRHITFVVFIFVAILPVCILFSGRFFGPGPLNRLLARRFFQWLGDISYAFYLFHGLTLVALRVLVRTSSIGGSLVGVWGFVIALVVSYLTALAVATFVHHEVEPPLYASLQRIARWWSGRTEHRVPAFSSHLQTHRTSD